MLNVKETLMENPLHSGLLMIEKLGVTAYQHKSSIIAEDRTRKIEFNSDLKPGTKDSRLKPWNTMMACASRTHLKHKNR